jgi:hypothetical protein
LFQFDANELRRARDAGKIYEPARGTKDDQTRGAQTKHSNVCFRDEYVYGFDEDLL